MTLDLNSLRRDADILEDIEKATLRMVTQAIYDFRYDAQEFFAHEPDLAADIGEDITREALDRMGASALPVRLFGKIDYKKARYVFHPEYSARQALFVDSKAEKVEGAGSATIQTAQTSMRIRQRRRGATVDEEGGLPSILRVQGMDFLSTTVFVKYNYRDAPNGLAKTLESVSLICLPSGLLQERYNPTAVDTFWQAGRNAPTRGEAFRVRIGLSRLKSKAAWRVQTLQLNPEVAFAWDE